MHNLTVGNESYGYFQQSQFGGNFLFHRDQLTTQGGFQELAQDLGVEHLRYPGGSVTEEYFDITAPNKASTLDEKTGETVDLVPMSEFLEAANASGQSVTIVIPTKHYLYNGVDKNGDRYEDINTQDLSDFVEFLVSGSFGPVDIDAFEIGNEYWGSGQMSAVEYGRVASAVSKIIDDKLTEMSLNFPAADDIDIVVQSGTNNNFSRLDIEYANRNSGKEIISDIEEKYDITLGDDYLYSSGEVNWMKVNNALIREQFDEFEFEGVDGIATHIYSKGGGNEVSRDFQLNLIKDTWQTENPEIQTSVTEWNLQSIPSLGRDEDYGLKNAAELLEIMEEFSAHSVDLAHVWPLLQNTKNALGNGFEYEDLTPAGEMFKLMEEILPNTRPIDLSGSARGQNELELGDISVHTFANSSQLSLFVASKVEGVTSSEIDLSGLVAGQQGIRIDILGVEEGDQPGSNKSTATLETIGTAEANTEYLRGGILSVDLDSYEIMRVVIEDPIWTSEMETYLQNSTPDAPGEDYDPPSKPDVLIPNDGPDEDDAPATTIGGLPAIAIEDANKVNFTEEKSEPASSDDDGGMGFGLIAFAILPFLSLLSLGF